ncbi:hypothetical protein J6590_028490 [Homalodisca vitripennis]|nr:hypothetical protein J6590_028490 [Homalodisca vitripennis]
MRDRAHPRYSVNRRHPPPSGVATGTAQASLFGLQSSVIVRQPLGLHFWEWHWKNSRALSWPRGSPVPCLAVATSSDIGTVVLPGRPNISCLFLVVCVHLAEVAMQVQRDPTRDGLQWQKAASTTGHQVSGHPPSRHPLSWGSWYRCRHVSMVR